MIESNRPAETAPDPRRRGRIGRRPVVLLTLAVLPFVPFSCELNRVVAHSQTDFVSAGEVGIALGNRDARVKIDGNPFGVGEIDMHAAIVGHVQAAWHQVPTRFTTAPDDSVHPRYKTVLVFDPAEPLPQPVLCGADLILTAPSDGHEIILEAAFCRGLDVVTRATGYIYGARTPDDPGLRTVIADIVRALFPRGNRRRVDE